VGSGVLTGKHAVGKPALKGSRAADPDQNSVIKKMYWKEEYKRRSQELVEIAGGMGVSAAQLAIAWCLGCPDVTSVILGARTVAQLKENLKAVDVKIPKDVSERMEELFPAN